MPSYGTGVRDLRDRRQARIPLIVRPRPGDRDAMGGRHEAVDTAQPAPAGAAAGVNTEAHVQLLGLGLDGTDVTPSVLLVFDKTRFLFNAGEGFQVRTRHMECAADV